MDVLCTVSHIFAYWSSPGSVTPVTYFIVERCIARFLCAMRVLKVRASSSSLRYLCAKFCFTHAPPASPWRKIMYSVTHSPSLFDAPGTKAFASQTTFFIKTGLWKRGSHNISSIIFPHAKSSVCSSSTQYLFIDSYQFMLTALLQLHCGSWRCFSVSCQEHIQQDVYMWRGIIPGESAGFVILLMKWRLVHFSQLSDPCVFIMWQLQPCWS